jgi:hypothetical protein
VSTRPEFRVIARESGFSQRYLFVGPAAVTEVNGRRLDDLRPVFFSRAANVTG